MTSNAEEHTKHFCRTHHFHNNVYTYLNRSIIGVVTALTLPQMLLVSSCKAVSLVLNTLPHVK